MISGDIKYTRSLHHKIQNFLDDRHVRGGKIAFGELPSVDDITIQYKDAGRNALQISCNNQVAGIKARRSTKDLTPFAFTFYRAFIISSLINEGWVLLNHK